MPLVVIPDDYQRATKQIQALHQNSDFEIVCLGALDRDAKAEEFLSKADALILIRERTLIDEKFLAKTPNLKLISQTGKVAYNIDLALCKQRGIAVVEGAGSPVSAAELTWLLIQSAIRRFVPSVAMMKEGHWQTEFGDTVAGKTLGIVGYGKIGQLVAKYAHAFDMKVQVWGSDRAQHQARQEGLMVPDSREAFFQTSDVITLHQRLVKETAGNITFSDLTNMKPSALLVNTARSGLIETGALEKALDLGTPGFAALDVFDIEPIWDTNHPLLKRNNVLCSPHIGYVTKSCYDLYFASAFENIERYFSGDKSHVINK
ncbi:D-2-hydroxyacid dehydrogenase family protein [Xenorhabdus sp. DI]|uniref:D-2-hydroxyacid dehydrogenase family protein n=1 Tax=Xenorhabdus doucetiae TaxID=351671 RepID=UPI00198984F2|nr:MULTISPECIES: D-2-hydroxyacid dehydrogenase family protein [unclassified Xenorhabdus]MBD2783880.1 D-2-hydroxyacid dehydrogenase family protein [Xenorhabdus sp. 3]MBD2788564.1 D-2-hydroxyacid dehydrogenase family protein [Xenorhabdus sp. DI]